MVLPQIIGITGRKYNGKDTLGDVFIKELLFEKLSFANNLKKAVKDIFDFTDEQIYGNKKEDVDEFWKISPRQVMQFIGTDLFRNQMKKILPNDNEDIWVKCVEKQILNDKHKHFVITDVRFQNEVDMIKKYGGIIIKIIRPSIIDISTHASEQNIDNIIADYDIINNGSVDDLKKHVFTLFKL